MFKQCLMGSFLVKREQQLLVFNKIHVEIQIKEFKKTCLWIGIDWRKLKSLSMSQEDFRNILSFPFLPSDEKAKCNFQLTVKSSQNSFHQSKKKGLFSLFKGWLVQTSKIDKRKLGWVALFLFSLYPSLTTFLF